MSPPSLLQRLGAVPGAADARLAWAIVLLALALYALGYAAFYPRGATVDDEGQYLEETLLWLETGSFQVEKLHPFTEGPEPFVPGEYPVGMVALMAPFAALFGLRGAFLASFFCLVAAVLLTARWLAGERRSPLFALILLAFPAMAVAGRLAMSDTARTAVAALGLWLFFLGLDGRRPGRWLASGFIAGSALTLRESAVLPFIPIFAGTVLRRDRGWGWLLLGGLAGTALHLGLNQAAFGDAFYSRNASRGFYPLELSSVHERLPLYLFGLLVLVPGGLWFGLSYRGRRRPEIVATVAFFLLFYVGQAYGMTASTLAKRLVIALRYFDPLLPVLAFAMAESLPRQLAALRAKMPERASFERLASAALVLWIAGALVTSFAVHPALGRWDAAQDGIRTRIDEHVPRDAVLVTNGTAIRKFIDDLARPYVTLWRDDVSDEAAAELRRRHGGYVVAFLDRSDSDYWRRDAAKNEAFAIERALGEPLVDERVTATDRLRIWRIGEPRRLTSR
jgi:4-amino-4-deoxy-L-arabinose transferase-like glycosyltransferase